ncbi:MAG: type II toxin-antitoxin system VapC family toxin [Pirellulaceae bacterium]
MKLLIDTHVFLWWMDDPAQLSSDSYAAIANTENEILVSAAVIWEIVIKSSLGKLSAPDNLDEVIQRSAFLALPIQTPHVLAIRNLPGHHRDPFDRILVAQAIVENATLVTRDANIFRYPVATIEA